MPTSSRSTRKGPRRTPPAPAFVSSFLPGARADGGPIRAAGKFSHTYTAGFLFCGLGAGARGFVLERTTLGKHRGRFINVGGVDIDPESCADFEALADGPAIQADLMEVDAKMLERIRGTMGARAPDVIFLSPPCLPGKEEVITPEGPRPIETMRANQFVLTHQGRFRRVLKVGSHVFKGTMVGLHLNGTVDVREFTDNHPIWVQRGKKGWGPLGDASFRDAGTVRVGDRVGFPVQPAEEGTAQRWVDSFGNPCLASRGGKSDAARAKSAHVADLVGRVVDLREVATSKALWFLLGAYLGDGYRRAARHEVAFCVGPEDGEFADQVREALEDLGITYNVDRNGGAGNVKVRVHAKHLCQLTGACGDGAEKKRLPEAFQRLEQPLADALFAGYFAADGSEHPARQQGRQVLQARRKVASVSLQLLRDFQRLLLRRGEFWGINVAARAGTATIEGRTVKTRDQWALVFRDAPKKRTIHEFKDGAVWIRVRRVHHRQAEERVWNMEVEEDNTFCAPLIGTHNCKAFSQLLPKAVSETLKYQRLNSLVLKGLHLICEAWPEPPALIVLENVPGIQKRGAELLKKARRLLSSYGFVFHEAVHDCGEVGGLAQHRKRYLLVGRRPSKVEDYVYQPPKQRVRACGEVLHALPLPGDPAAGPLHQLPNLSWLNWLRLALIPEGGDWRDLPTSQPVDEAARKDWLQKGVKAEGQPNLFKDKHGVMEWGRPARAIIGGPSNGASNVAQPLRIAELQHAPHRGSYEVVGWGSPFRTVRGVARASNGAGAVAQPFAEGPESLPEEVLLDACGDVLTSWCFQDSLELGPLLSMGSDNPGRHTNKYAVTPWSRPARTVTGTDTRVGSGAAVVADARVGDQALPGGLGFSCTPNLQPLESVVALRSTRRNRFANQYRMTSWDEAARTITGDTDIQEGAQSVAQPLPAGMVELVQLKQTAANAEGFHGRPGLMGVLDWNRPSPTVTGKAVVSSGNASAAVADPTIGTRSSDSAVAADVCIVELGLGSPLHPGQERRSLIGRFDLRPWDAPARTVTGNGSNGGYGVADPRVQQVAAALAQVAPHGPRYVVMSWEQAAWLLTSGLVNPSSSPDFIPVILSKDRGTWHRPLTTLELAHLQGLPPTHNGKPLHLAGKSVSRKRERIGNAVPVKAAGGIARSLLLALIASETGEYQLGTTGRWVRKQEGARLRTAEPQPQQAPEPQPSMQ